MKSKKTIVMYGHDLAEVMANRFSSLQEFADKEPTFVGTMISMGEIEWLLNRYNGETENDVETAENSVTSQDVVESRIRPGRRGGGDRIIQDSDEEVTTRISRKAGIRRKYAHGRGPTIYDYVDQDFTINANEAAAARKPGEVTMKVHVPNNEDAIPLFFNTDAKNLGKNRNAKAARDMFSSSRRKFVKWQRECGVKVKSTAVSVCRAYKNKRA